MRDAPDREHEHGGVEHEPHPHSNRNGKQGKRQGCQRVPRRIWIRQDEYLLYSDAKIVCHHLLLACQVIQRDAAQEPGICPVEHLKIKERFERKRREPCDRQHDPKRDDPQRTRESDSFHAR